MNRFYFLLASILLLFTILPGFSATAQTLETREVLDSLDTPWEILWGPDDWIWMTERGGQVSRVNPTTGERILLFTVPGVYEESESGLLGMALHPGFNDTAWVFLVYTYRESNQIRERLVRYTYNGTTLVSPTTLIEGISGNTTHDGSRLMITPDRILYMTTGDAQITSAPQSHTSLSGKILRMTLNGTVPADNPFPNAPAPYNLIWTTGHRNPQGLVRAHNGIIYGSEHGPGDNDEINIFTQRGNFGWPNVHGPCDTPGEMQFCQDSSVIEPIRAWSPTLATAGLDAYNHPAIPEWSNSLLLVNLKESDLRVLKLSGDGLSITGETTFFNNQFGRLRDLCVSPDGRVFIATSNRDGRGSPRVDDDKIIEIKASTAEPASIVSISAAPGSFAAGGRFQVSVTTEGTFTAGNQFAIQLSDSSGSFVPVVVDGNLYPMVIGRFTSTTGGNTNVQVPCLITAGSGYRVRAISTTPVDTSSDNGVDIPLRGVVVPEVTASGSTTICEGDSVTLIAAPGYRTYRWNTGRSGDRVTVKEGRNYSVEVTDSNGCVIRSAPVAIILLPRPTPTITADGRFLATEDEFPSYQWLLDGQPVPGATERTFTAPSNGRYSIRVTSNEGCSGTSNEIEVTGVGVKEVESIGGAMSIHPHPVREHAILALELEKGGSLEMVMRNVAGEIVSRFEDEARPGTYRREISLRGLPAGSYFVTLTSGEKIWRTILIKE